MRVLLVEDNEDHVLLVRETLAHGGRSPVELLHVDRLSRALELVAEDGIEVVLLDLTLPDSKGLDTVARMHAAAPAMPFVVLTVLENEEVGLQAVQKGAQDYLLKNKLDRDLLVRTLRYAVERKHAERCLAAEHAVSRALAESVTLQEATSRMLQAICQSLEWDWGALWREDPESHALRCVDLWHRPDRSYPDFERISRTVSFPPGVGLPGRVWISRQPAWVADFGCERGLPRAPFAAKSGLHAALLLPIVFGGQVWGVIEFFSHRIREPDDRLVGMIHAIGTQFGQFLVRKLAEEAFHAQGRLLQTVVNSINEGLVAVDRSGNTLLFNPSAEQILGMGPSATTPDQWPEHYGLYLPDTVTPFSGVDLALARAMGGENVRGRDVFLRNARKPHGTWLRSSATPLQDPDQKLQGAVVVFRDVTDEKAAERRRVEILAAREIQQHLFPARAPALAGFDLAGASHPAEETTGDLFDYLTLADGALGIAVGDVSGHGLGPALLMAETRACLRVLARTHLDPGQILTVANRMLTEDIADDRFVTLFLGKLNPRTRSFVHASAGHRSYLLGVDGEVQVLEGTSPPLASEREIQVTCAAPIVLEPGQLLLFVTDGIVEASAADGTPFGIHRALELIRGNRALSARELVDGLTAAVREHCAGKPQDDTTVVVLKVELGV